MNSINLIREITSSMESAIDRITATLKAEGFGVLTRIDLHTKIKEKLGQELQAVVILGACNPQLAFEAYTKNKDVAGLLPCNAVLRDIGNSLISVELTKPSTLMTLLGDQELEKMALDADNRLSRALEQL